MCFAACVVVVVVAAALAGQARAADFRRGADGACAAYDRQTNALPKITSAAELKRQLVLVPRLFTSMVNRIGALRAPQGGVVQTAHLVAALRQIQHSLARIRDAFLHGDQAAVAAAVRTGTPPSRTAARLSRALGLPTCARIASQAIEGQTP